MKKNSENFSMQEIMRLASSPAGRQLMQLLQTDHTEAVDAVMQNAQTGQMEQAQQSLRAFLTDPKARALLQKLQEEYHG